MFPFSWVGDSCPVGFKAQLDITAAEYARRIDWFRPEPELRAVAQSEFVTHDH
jgi:hypothetical protein